MQTSELEVRVGAASLLMLGLSLALAALLVFDAPTPEELAAADPLVRLVASRLGLWALPLLPMLPAAGWLYFRRPTPAARLRMARHSATAVALVAIGMPLFRLLVGPTLPAFIPAEESAAPGMALGVGAGVIEEAFFRLGVLPLTFVLVRRWMPLLRAAVVSIVFTGFAFALAHELAAPPGAFDLGFFLTRFLIPGCAMSAFFFVPGPSFIVTLHVAAHVGLALLFPA